MREGHTKKTGKLLIALLLRAEARGLFLQPSQHPTTQTHTQGPDKCDKHPSFRTKRMRGGHTKKTGKLLIALLLRAEAWGLFLQPSQDPMTQTHTLGLSKRDKQPSFRMKRMRKGRTKKTGKLLIALLLRAEARGLFLQPNRAKRSELTLVGPVNVTKPSLNMRNAPRRINPLLQGLEGYTQWVRSRAPTEASSTKHHAMSQVSSKPQGERSHSPQGSGASVGYHKKGSPKQELKNHLDLVNIEAKRQPPANPHLIRGPAEPPGPPQTVS